MGDEHWEQEEARETLVQEGCVWCKDPVEDGAMISTGEEICSNCLEDCREYGRFRQTAMFHTRGLGPSVTRIVNDHWDAVTAELDDLYADREEFWPLPKRKSDALTYELPRTQRLGRRGIESTD